MNMLMILKNETKSCYRFEQRRDDGTFLTLYLKKEDVKVAGINPEKGIQVTIEEA